MIASDLDGTVRQPIEPFNTWRDTSQGKYVRIVSGLIATVLARRINKQISVDCYITGSPHIECRLTRLWLKVHRIPGNVYCNRKWGRETIRSDGDSVSALHKVKIIKQLKVTRFYEDNSRQAIIIRNNCNAEIIEV